MWESLLLSDCSHLTSTDPRGGEGTPLLGGGESLTLCKASSDNHPSGDRRDASSAPGGGGVPAPHLVFTSTSQWRSKSLLSTWPSLIPPGGTVVTSSQPREREVQVRT